MWLCAGATWGQIAHRKAAISRAMAVTTGSFLPMALSRRYRAQQPDQSSLLFVHEMAGCQPQPGT
jgi:hypothetical protein